MITSLRCSCWSHWCFWNLLNWWLQFARLIKSTAIQRGRLLQEMGAALVDRMADRSTWRVSRESMWGCELRIGRVFIPRKKGRGAGQEFVTNWCVEMGKAIWFNGRVHWINGMRFVWKLYII
jgi:hypothetical protein